MRTIEHWMLYRCGRWVYRAYSIRSEARSAGEDPEVAADRSANLGLPTRELVRLSSTAFTPRTVQAMPTLEPGELVSFEGVRYRVQEGRGGLDLVAV